MQKFYKFFSLNFQKIKMKKNYNNIKQKSFLINLLLILSVFLLSLFITPFYIEGDQAHYKKVYEGLRDLSITNGFIYYTSNLDSKEIVHFFLSWISTNQGIDKSIFVAFSNSLLAYAVVKLLRHLRVSIFIIIILLLTNFYFYVLYFAAERLKFGLIFLILSFSFSTSRFYFFSFIAIISHMQVIIVYGAIFFKQVVLNIIQLLLSAKLKLSLVILIGIFPILFLFIGDHIVTKFIHYYGEHDITDLFKIFIFFIFSLYYSKNTTEVILIFFPLFVTVYLIGGERINMIGYFIFLYYALPINRGFNFGVLSTSIYFLFSTIKFMYNIFTYGDGFYGS